MSAARGNTAAPARQQQAVAASLLIIPDHELEAACRAHWPTWDRMRAEHVRKWREKMRAALVAATLARRP